jgi:hypothetical protein
VISEGWPRERIDQGVTFRTQWAVVTATSLPQRRLNWSGELEFVPSSNTTMTIKNGGVLA